MSHTLRVINGEDDTIAELEMVVGFGDGLAGEATGVANRLPRRPACSLRRAGGRVVVARYQGLVLR
jgi:hypothetical protein